MPPPVTISLASIFISLIVSFIVINPDKFGIPKFLLGWLVIGIVLTSFVSKIASFFIS